MKLYEIDNKLMDLFDDDGNVIDLNAFENLEVERNNKIESIALYIKNLNAEIEALKNERDNFVNRIKATETKASNLKEYLQDYLDGERFKSSKVVISYRKTSKVIVDDIEKLEKEYIREKIIKEPDKIKLKDVLTSGTELTGARLEISQSMNIK